ncbi:hypothetical protein Tco_0562870, partial [Tanacetum coccineum]
MVTHSNSSRNFGTYLVQNSVNGFSTICLIGSSPKVVIKILANRLALVIADLVSDTQSAFIA